MKKRYLDTAEDRKAAKSLGIPIESEEVIRYFIRVTEVIKPTRKLMGPRVMPQDYIILGNPANRTSPVGISGEVYTYCLFTMKKEPYRKIDMEALILTKYKKMYTSQQLKSGIAGLIKAGYLVKYQPTSGKKSQEKNK